MCPQVGLLHCHQLLPGFFQHLRHHAVVEERALQVVVFVLEYPRHKVVEGEGQRAALLILRFDLDVDRTL